ncbi:beta-glucosidase [Chitinophaga terrae (ex Kim and Jung 2007)]|uniref:beta-glucosidase BglX n=1 Tax=Chitinophaga terrae (ex Kim and Jung 2007) TaxID=408074 RepID=UPI00278A3E7A|nr:beta-glucosidase BglX [Chitinophaga terrae (ex Kim and Jung 2007)]MDQ0109008.1 beta-glucosidase [Chitinophaga terrae (ex Kim and Jung 2007)]
MKYLKLPLLLACSLFFQAAAAQKQTDLQMKTFVDGLIQKMTLEEKIGQLNLLTSGEVVTGSAVSTGVEAKIKSGQVGALLNMTKVADIRKAQQIAVEQSRLHIPLLFGLDVVHGYKTTFPIPLALSCSWDLEMIERSARVAAIEASADGINWTFSPMVDIARDARWGRIAEGSGEDPYLGSRIAEAMVRGYQGTTFADKTNILACVKHFALYGAAEAGRDYNTTDMSRVRMYNEYFPPYKAAVDAGVATVMTSFNEVNGIPATANKWLMTDVLRKQWGFKGFVVTDYTAINEMTAHGMGDLQTVSALALNAGTDMDMVGEGFTGTLAKSVKEGKVTINAINTACRRILEAKYKLGLFADPYRNCKGDRSAEIFTPEKRMEARKAATESFVLLKNQQQLLPLKKQGSIALVGPLANSRANMTGTWSVSADLTQHPSLLEALQQQVGSQVKINYAKGANLTADSILEINSTMFGRSLNRDGRSAEALRREALDAAAKSDIIVAALGESSEMSGESASRTDIGIPDTQKELLAALVATGKPVVLVLFAGRPMTLTWENEHVPAILDVWFGGCEAGPAIVDVLFGDVNPSGKLTTSFPQNVGQLPLYYSQKNTGRPLAGNDKWFTKFRSNYLDVSNDPLYPFGYGLSYTTFSYSDIRLSANQFKRGGQITATVTVTNTGKYDGYEVVQLYTRDMVGSITRPVKELKGFQRIALKAGESKQVTFTITENDLKFYNSELKYAAEPGEFRLFIGGNSRDVKESSFTLL